MGNVWTFFSFFIFLAYKDYVLLHVNFFEGRGFLLSFFKGDLQPVSNCPQRRNEGVSSVFFLVQEQSGQLVCTKRTFYYYSDFQDLILLSKIPSGQLFSEFNQYFTWINPGAQTVIIQHSFFSVFFQQAQGLEPELCVSFFSF